MEQSKLFGFFGRDVSTDSALAASLCNAPIANGRCVLPSSAAVPVIISLRLIVISFTASSLPRAHRVRCAKLVPNCNSVDGAELHLVLRHVIAQNIVLYGNF